MNSSHPETMQAKLRTSLLVVGMASLAVLLVLMNISAARPPQAPGGHIQTAIALTNQVLLLLSTPSTPFPKNPNLFLVNVFSAQYPFENTHIHVRPGDQVDITVQGQNPTWACNRSEQITPTGYIAAHSAETLDSAANQCALIGAIAAPYAPLTDFFLVGAHTTLTVTRSGSLFLGCNDIESQFNDNPTDSHLQVQIVITN